MLPMWNKIKFRNCFQFIAVCVFFNRHHLYIVDVVVQNISFAKCLYIMLENLMEDYSHLLDQTP